MADRELNALALTKLGLTISQAKAYLALVTIGKATARAIWKNSGICRQDIYRVLGELQEKCLVEKILMTPEEFKAVPLKDGLTILLKSEAEKYKNARAEAKALLQTITACNKEERVDDESQFSLIPEKEGTIRKFRLEIDNAQTSIEGIFYWKGLLPVLEDSESLRTAIERGVKLRLVVYAPQEEKTITKAIRLFQKTNAFHIRYTINPPPSTITIFDGEKVIVSTTTNPKPVEKPSLWIRNQSLAAVIREYFEHQWQKSSPAPKRLNQEKNAMRDLTKNVEPLELHLT